MLERKALAVNAITMSRGVLLVFFPLLASGHELAPNGILFALSIVLLSVAAFTDLIDGWLARRWKVTSRFGAMADPLMDKIFYICTLPTLVFMAAYRGETAHAVLLLAFAAPLPPRAPRVTFLRSIGNLGNAKMGANWSGKVRTLLAFPVIILVYLACGAGWKQATPFLMAAEAVCLAVNLISVWVYSQFYWPFLLKAVQQSQSDHENS